MWNTLKDRKFTLGFAVGVAVCFAVFGPMFFIGKNAADKLLVASTGNRAALESCTAKMADLNSRWTLIMDRPISALPTVQIMDGLMAIAPGRMLTAGMAAYPRWELPVKVTPYVAGPTDGAVYYYWNPETRELDGPHVPLSSEKR